MSTTPTTPTTTSASPTSTRPAPTGGFRSFAHPVRLVIPIGFFLLLAVVFLILRLKSRAKVRADGPIALAAQGDIDSRGWTARVRDGFASVKTAMNTPWTDYQQWKVDQQVLKSAEGRWGSGHGIVTLEPTSSVPRRLEAGDAANPVAAAPVVDTVELLEVEEPPAAARGHWERWFRR